MPDIIGDSDTDLLAAEYVLGTLDADERSRSQVLLGIDHGFSGMVKVWERRLGELHVMVEPVEPAPKVWERIKAKLSDTQPALDFPVAPTPSAAGAPAVAADEPAASAATAPAGLTTPEEVEAAIAALAPAKPATPARPAPSERRPVAVDKAAPGARTWQVATALMTLVAVVLIGLFAAIKFVPDRVPMQVKQVLLPAGLVASQGKSGLVRRPAPPGSSFEE